MGCGNETKRIVENDSKDLGMSSRKDEVTITRDGESEAVHVVGERLRSISHSSEDFEFAVDRGAWNLRDVNLRDYI